VFRGTWELLKEADPFHLRGYHPLWPDFPDSLAINQLCNSLGKKRLSPMTPATPTMQRPSALTHCWFRLFPVRSPLLGKSLLFSVPGVTKMFQFTPFASQDLCVQSRDTVGLPTVGFPIRKSPDQRVFAAPRGLSQLTTSFIAARRQGIRQVPLVA
jgi:hypothetical protein